jgi:ADA HAT complex component 1
VSDDEDDHASGSDEEAPLPATIRHAAQVEVGLSHQRTEGERFCADNAMSVDVEEGDEIDGQHGVVIRRNSMVREEKK